MKIHIRNDYLEGVISCINTSVWGKRIATWIAVDLFGFESCGCCERKQWLNRLTDKEYNGNCKDIKLW